MRAVFKTLFNIQIAISGRFILNLRSSFSKCHFFLAPLHFCLSFGFVFIRMRSWDPEISVSKSRQGWSTFQSFRKLKKSHSVCFRYYSYINFFNWFLYVSSIWIHTIKPYTCYVIQKYCPVSNSFFIVRCKICSTLITNKSSCNRHFKVHSGEKSYVCPICNKAFYRQDYLQRHLKTHGNSTGSELESLVKLAMNGVKKQW